MAKGATADDRQMLDQHLAEQHQGGGFPTGGRSRLAWFDDHRTETLTPTHVVDSVHIVIVDSTTSLRLPTMTVNAAGIDITRLAL